MSYDYLHRTMLGFTSPMPGLTVMPVVGDWTVPSDRYGLGFPGIDEGSTSSWYVLSSLGFYTVDPAEPVYILGSPLFNQTTIHLANGKDFVIVAHGNSADNIYIQSATLNGKPLNKPWFSHSDIANGARLILTMGTAPKKNWGSNPAAAPPSMSHPR